VSNARQPYSITAKGRSVLHGPTLWGLAGHLRDVLALCDPQVRIEHLQQCVPPHTLQKTLYALQELGLIEGPAVDVPDISQRLWGKPASGRPAALVER